MWTLLCSFCRGDTKHYLSKERELFIRLTGLGVGDVDVVILNAAGVELGYNVIATGQLLFARIVNKSMRCLKSTISLITFTTNLSLMNTKPLFPAASGQFYPGRDQQKESH